MQSLTADLTVLLEQAANKVKEIQILEEKVQKLEEEARGDRDRIQDLEREKREMASRLEDLEARLRDIEKGMTEGGQGGLGAKGGDKKEGEGREGHRVQVGWGEGLVGLEKRMEEKLLERERENKRRCQIRITGLEEGEREDSLGLRKRVVEIFEEKMKVAGSAAMVVDVFRVGKRGGDVWGRPRVVLARVSSEWQRKQILMGKPNLRGCKGLGVDMDRTREEVQELRMSLKKRREEGRRRVPVGGGNKTGAVGRSEHGRKEGGANGVAQGGRMAERVNEGKVGRDQGLVGKKEEGRGKEQVENITGNKKEEKKGEDKDEEVEAESFIEAFSDEGESVVGGGVIGEEEEIEEEDSREGPEWETVTPRRRGRRGGRARLREVESPASPWKKAAMKAVGKGNGGSQEPRRSSRLSGGAEMANN